MKNNLDIDLKEIEQEENYSIENNDHFQNINNFGETGRKLINDQPLKNTIKANQLI